MTIGDFVKEGQLLTEIEDCTLLKKEYDAWCGKVNRFLKKEGRAEYLNDIKVKMHYTENEYSKEETKKSIINALNKTTDYLEGGEVVAGKDLPKEIVLMLVERIINNFYMYYRAMYKNPVHKGGTLNEELLKNIQIGNEYDLQRMLYSILLPVFPSARLEVDSDNGCSGMRADIYLEDYDIVIETKCTRDTMKEKKLTEELGADGFHYKASAIMFFVYDKSSIIKNPEAFQNAFTREQSKDGKDIRLIIFQPTNF